MTTFYNFAPNNSQAFRFQPTFDGQVYNVVVSWNLFGARYYVNIYDLSGTLIVCLPLVGSPAGHNLQTLSWASGIVTAVAVLPHGFRVGETANLSISGATPDAYNGEFSCFVTDRITLQYPLATDPGAEATVPGEVSYGVSMTAGYFASTMIFRAPSQQFEISP